MKNNLPICSCGYQGWRHTQNGMVCLECGQEIADTKPKPKPCPFCGGEDMAPRNLGRIWYMMCLICQALGPIANTPAEAGAAWDRRTP